MGCLLETATSQQDDSTLQNILQTMTETVWTSDASHILTSSNKNRTKRKSPELNKLFEPWCYSKWGVSERLHMLCFNSRNERKLGCSPCIHIWSCCFMSFPESHSQQLQWHTSLTDRRKPELRLCALAGFMQEIFSWRQLSQQMSQNSFTQLNIQPIGINRSYSQCKREGWLHS